MRGDNPDVTTRGGKTGKSAAPPCCWMVVHVVDIGKRRTGMPSSCRMTWTDARGRKPGGVGGGVFEFEFRSASMDAVGDQTSSPEDDGATSGTSPLEFRPLIRLVFSVFDRRQASESRDDIVVRSAVE
jgi:hypothetical protein